MKYITSILCCLAFAVCGVSLALSENKDLGFKHPSVSAATVPQYYALPKLPLDVQLDLDKKYKHDPDTVYLPGETVIKYKTKYKTKYLSAPDTESMVARPDSLSTPVEMDIGAIKNQAGVVREEQTTDNIGPPKESIILVVDGEEVYKR